MIIHWTCINIILVYSLKIIIYDLGHNVKNVIQD